METDLDTAAIAATMTENEPPKASHAPEQPPSPRVDRVGSSDRADDEDQTEHVSSSFHRSIASASLSRVSSPSSNHELSGDESEGDDSLSFMNTQDAPSSVVDSILDSNADYDSIITSSIGFRNQSSVVSGEEFRSGPHTHRSGFEAYSELDVHAEEEEEEIEEEKEKEESGLEAEATATPEEPAVEEEKNAETATATVEESEKAVETPEAAEPSEVAEAATNELTEANEDVVPGAAEVAVQEEEPCEGGGTLEPPIPEAEPAPTTSEDADIDANELPPVDILLSAVEQDMIGEDPHAESQSAEEEKEKVEEDGVHNNPSASDDPLIGSIPTSPDQAEEAIVATDSPPALMPTLDQNEQQEVEEKAIASEHSPVSPPTSSPPPSTEAIPSPSAFFLAEVRQLADAVISSLVSKSVDNISIEKSAIAAAEAGERPPDATLSAPSSPQPPSTPPSPASPRAETREDVEQQLESSEREESHDSAEPVMAGPSPNEQEEQQRRDQECALMLQEESWQRQFLSLQRIAFLQALASQQTQLSIQSALAHAEKTCLEERRLKLQSPPPQERQASEHGVDLEGLASQPPVSIPETVPAPSIPEAASSPPPPASPSVLPSLPAHLIEEPPRDSMDTPVDGEGYDLPLILLGGSQEGSLLDSGSMASDHSFQVTLEIFDRARSASGVGKRLGMKDDESEGVEAAKKGEKSPHPTPAPLPLPSKEREEEAPALPGERSHVEDGEEKEKDRPASSQSQAPPSPRMEKDLPAASLRRDQEEIPIITSFPSLSHWQCLHPSYLPASLSSYALPASQFPLVQSALTSSLSEAYLSSPEKVDEAVQQVHHQLLEQCHVLTSFYLRYMASSSSSVDEKEPLLVENEAWLQLLAQPSTSLSAPQTEVQKHQLLDVLHHLEIRLSDQKTAILSRVHAVTAEIQRHVESLSLQQEGKEEVEGGEGKRSEGVFSLQDVLAFLRHPRLALDRWGQPPPPHLYNGRTTVHPREKSQQTTQQQGQMVQAHNLIDQRFHQFLQAKQTVQESEDVVQAAQQVVQSHLAAQLQNAGEMLTALCHPPYEREHKTATAYRRIFDAEPTASNRRRKGGDGGGGEDASMSDISDLDGLPNMAPTDQTMSPPRKGKLTWKTTSSSPSFQALPRTMIEPHQASARHRPSGRPASAPTRRQLPSLPESSPYAQIQHVVPVGQGDDEGETIWVHLSVDDPSPGRRHRPPSAPARHPLLLSASAESFHRSNRFAQTLYQGIHLSQNLPPFTFPAPHPLPDSPSRAVHAAASSSPRSLSPSPSRSAPLRSSTLLSANEMHTKLKQGITRSSLFSRNVESTLQSTHLEIEDPLLHNLLFTRGKGIPLSRFAWTKEMLDCYAFSPQKAIAFSKKAARTKEDLEKFKVKQAVRLKREEERRRQGGKAGRGRRQKLQGEEKSGAGGDVSREKRVKLKGEKGRAEALRDQVRKQMQETDTSFNEEEVIMGSAYKPPREALLAPSSSPPSRREDEEGKADVPASPTGWKAVAATAAAVAGVTQTVRSTDSPGGQPLERTTSSLVREGMTSTAPFVARMREETRRNRTVSIHPSSSGNDKALAALTWQGEVGQGSPQDLWKGMELGESHLHSSPSLHDPPLPSFSPRSPGDRQEDAPSLPCRADRQARLQAVLQACQLSPSPEEVAGEEEVSEESLLRLWQVCLSQAFPALVSYLRSVLAQLYPRESQVEMILFLMEKTLESSRAREAGQLPPQLCLPRVSTDEKGQSVFNVHRVGYNPLAAEVVHGPVFHIPAGRHIRVDLKDFLQDASLIGEAAQVLGHRCPSPAPFKVGTIHSHIGSPHEGSPSPSRPLNMASHAIDQRIDNLLFSVKTYRRHILNALFSLCEASLARLLYPVLFLLWKEARFRTQLSVLQARRSTSLEPVPIEAMHKQVKAMLPEDKFTAIEPLVALAPEVFLACRAQGITRLFAQAVGKCEDLVQENVDYAKHLASLTHIPS